MSFQIFIIDNNILHLLAPNYVALANVEFRQPLINQKIIISLPSEDARKLSETFKWTKIFKLFSIISLKCLKYVEKYF